MTMLERREKCRQNRLAEQHFRPLGARQMRSRILLAPLEARGPTPAKTLPMNAVQSIGGVGIGESKRKSRLNCWAGGRQDPRRARPVSQHPQAGPDGAFAQGLRRTGRFVANTKRLAQGGTSTIGGDIRLRLQGGRAVRDDNVTNAISSWRAGSMRNQSKSSF